MLGEVAEILSLLAKWQSGIELWLLIDEVNFPEGWAKVRDVSPSDDLLPNSS